MDDFGCALTLLDASIIHVTIAQRSPCDIVPAHATGGHCACGAEGLIEVGFADLRMQITHVEAGKLQTSGDKIWKVVAPTVKPVNIDLDSLGYLGVAAEDWVFTLCIQDDPRCRFGFRIHSCSNM